MASPLPLDVGYLCVVVSSIYLSMLVQQLVLFWCSGRRRCMPGLLLCHLNLQLFLLQTVETVACILLSLSPDVSILWILLLIL